ncbi:MAG: hypothetical protein Q8P05_00460 [Candidatus Diapherotrites archaeon]|nr:hypothetical protein [Candidatus Diapherotrites archaeon]
MGWYGVFLVPKLKLIFSLRSIDENKLHDHFDSLDRFFSKYDKLKEDIEYIQTITEENKSFSAKVTAKMFNIIDELGYLPDISNSVFLLYFLHKHQFEIDYHSEHSIELGKYKKKGWQMVE